MAAVGSADVFQARFEAMLNNHNQRKQLLQAETRICISKRDEYREQRSRERHFEQFSLKFYVQAQEVTLKIKAIEDEREAANLALKHLESKLKCLSAELFELQKKRNCKREFYECNEAELRDFKQQLSDRALSIQAKTMKTVAEADTHKNDLQKVRQFAAGSCEVGCPTNVDEIERIRLVSVKQAIGRDVCSNLNAVRILEQRLHDAIQGSKTKKRNLAAAVETLKAEITVLEIAERKTEALVLQAITRRDRRKRELHDLECELARKKMSFTHLCQE